MRKKYEIDKKIKRFTAAALLFSLMALSAVPAFADQTPSQKDEVVYADLGAAGQPERIYVVNIFENQKSILDYGNYESVRNMTSADKIRENGDKVLIETDQDMLYYQGNLKEGELPWSIGLTYWLDGRETVPQDLAGSSGQLKLQITVTKNPKAKKDFFDNYALQITAAFDTEKCGNIRCEGATEANAGRNRQLTWTLLPGTEKTLEVQAAVKNFEMESLSFNGVRLNMDADVDSGKLTDKFEQLSTAVSAIDRGAKGVAKGTEQADSGAKKLKKGTGELDKSVEQLSRQTKQVGKLGTASSEIKGAVETLDQGMEKVKEGISYDAYKQAMAQNGLNIDELKNQNTQMMTLLDQLKALAEQLPEPTKTQLLSQISQAKKLTQGNIAAAEGTEQYLNKAAEGLSETEKGAAALAEKYGEFDRNIQKTVKQLQGLDLSQISKLTKGAEDLAKGTGKMKKGSSALAQGTDQLSSKTSDMGRQAQEQIDEMLQGISGTDADTVSFVSEKNTDVRSVQFVIKNDPIEIPEKEPPAESSSEKLSWWQKLLALFGIK
ncbi:hypothetical protein NE619_01175 [Anaerovorax odorimutans]|uniref:X-X-X-Leu-X-X-Gly heptad repeat protein n=1 Tax=Anaerovorax odorimutans TaxID=109327 RepID=A0ABT1RJF7_9FIRM|nr:hypothetical protein [Anaerovorax odorimutans]MCQ4635327.1 hypothetical protein [Anaerovorax odorimutans]